MTGNIHPTAVIHPGAGLGADVRIGPYTIVEADVEIGAGCTIGPSVVIASGTRMGKGCQVFQGASVGAIPQDLKFSGEKTLLRIGEHTTIREFCTLNRGTKAKGETVVGSHCHLMAYCHIAHDCQVGDYFVAANYSALAGHVTIGNHVRAGGVTAVVQFCQVGDHSFLGAYSLITKDVVPFALVAPGPVRIVGINKIGLERDGFDEPRRREIRRAYQILFRRGLTCDNALRTLQAEFPQNNDVASIVAFAAQSKRSLLRMRREASDDESEGSPGVVPLR